MQKIKNPVLYIRDGECIKGDLTLLRHKKNDMSKEYCSTRQALHNGAMQTVALLAPINFARAQQTAQHIAMVLFLQDEAKCGTVVKPKPLFCSILLCIFVYTTLIYTFLKEFLSGCVD